METNCKLCDKKYPCGKSLEGHMRYHEKFEASKLKKVESWNWNSSSGKNQSKSKFDHGIPPSYGIRENPKKTWSADLYCLDSPKILRPNPSFGGSDTHINHIDSKYQKVCQQCGKVFHSMKALCGHMACHSEKDKGGLKDNDDNSWTSSDHSHSDTEADELISQSCRSKTTKRYKKIVVKSNNTYNCLSSVFEIDEEHEQEELAKWLIMLSRDTRTWNGVSSLVETSDNKSVVLETKASSSDMRNNARKNGLKRVNNQDAKPRMKKEGDRNTKVDMLEAETQSEKSDSGYYLGENRNVKSDGSVERYLGNGNEKWSTSKVPLGAWLHEHRTDEKKVLNKIKQYLKESSKKFERDVYGLASNSDICESRKRKTDDPGIRNDSKKMKVGIKSPEECKNDIHKTRKYECLNCKKVFSSYQALGGHRPCHKKINDYSESTYETGENNLSADREVFRKNKPAVPSQDLPYEPEKKVKPKKSKGHKCPFCYRMFKSGQALGGHKRSHFIHGGDQENLNQQCSAVKRQVVHLLDLNLPAPVDEEDDEHARFMSW